MTSSSQRRYSAIALAMGAVLLALGLGSPLLQLPLGERAVELAVAVGAGALVAGLLLWFSPDACASATPGLMRRYYREFLPPIIGYVVVVLCWKPLLAMVESVWLRVVVALLPALLVLAVTRAMLRYVRDSDELQRRIELESIAVAAMLVSCAYLAAGFLQTAALISVPAKTAMLWVFPLLCLTYGLVKIVIARRYQ